MHDSESDYRNKEDMNFINERCNDCVVSFETEKHINIMTHSNQRR